MDADARMEHLAQALTAPIVEYFINNKPTTRARSPNGLPGSPSGPESAFSVLDAIHPFQRKFAKRAAVLLHTIRDTFLQGTLDSANATPTLLAKGTRAVYEFIRYDLGVKMRGLDNSAHDRGISEQLVLTEPLLGDDVTVIYEAIRDSKMRPMLLGLFGPNGVDV